MVIGIVVNCEEILKYIVTNVHIIEYHKSENSNIRAQSKMVIFCLFFPQRPRYGKGCLIAYNTKN